MTDQQPDTQPPAAVTFDYQKWTHELKRADATRAFDRWDSQFDKLNDAAIKVAEGTLRGGLLINGGAAVSVLAFIGSLATKDIITVVQLTKIASSLVIFAVGVALAVLGMGLSYLTHFLGAGRVASFKRQWEPPYISDGPRTKLYTRLTRVTHFLAFLAGLACILLFICGMISVRNSIGSLGSY